MSLQDLVIVTGMSGSGKGTVLRTFEDLGFFCIDNLPVALIPKLVEGIQTAGDEVKRAVLVIDIRAGEKLKDLELVIQELRKSAFHLFVLYLEAEDDVLVRRFSETRRPHPLSKEKSLRESIRVERARLSSLREFADVDGGYPFGLAAARLGRGALGGGVEEPVDLATQAIHQRPWVLADLVHVSVPRVTCWQVLDPEFWAQRRPFKAPGSP